MASFLRKYAVRTMAIGVSLGSLAGVVAAVIEERTIVTIAAAVTVLLVAGLILAVSRRQQRAVNTASVATQKVIADLYERLAHERVQRGDIEGLRAALARVEEAQEQNESTLAGTSAALVRTEGMLGALTESVAGLSTETGKTARAAARLHREILTDAQGLYQLMQRYQPTEPLPIVGGWAMDPTGLLWLTRHIHKAQPDLVVECGSGTSTLWCAMALRETGQGKLVALEHQPEFAQRTRDLLSEHGLLEWAEVVDAPLVETETPRGTFPWYDTAGLELDGIGALIVDGPPESTGKLARYPALPAMMEKLTSGATVVVDDMHRADERECVDLWAATYPEITQRREINRYISVLNWR